VLSMRPEAAVGERERLEPSRALNLDLRALHARMEQVRATRSPAETLAFSQAFV